MIFFNYLWVDSVLEALILRLTTVQITTDSLDLRISSDLPTSANEIGSEIRSTRSVN